MIPQQQIDRIRQDANDDIVAVVQRYVKLKRSGSGYKGLCPFHDENTPSFHVTERKGIYKCFGCQEGGDAIDFVMKVEGMDFIEAIRHLAGMLGIIINEEKGKPPKNYTPPNALIPGIKKVKRHIRKADQSIICFDDSILAELRDNGNKNTLQLDGFGSKQAQLLKKYSEKLLIICQGIKPKTLFRLLTIANKNGLYIKLAITPSDDPEPWTKFIIKNFGNTKKIRSACLKIISKIPDAIHRAIMTQQFAKYWDKSKEKE